MATAECREPVSSDRLPVHRSESPTGYSSAGCSPAEPASASPVSDNSSLIPIRCLAVIQALVCVRRHRGCHLYFAHRVTFLSCADIACKRRMKMSPACQLLQMTLPPGISGVFRGDGSADERSAPISVISEAPARRPQPALLGGKIIAPVEPGHSLPASRRKCCGERGFRFGIARAFAGKDRYPEIRRAMKSKPRRSMRNTAPRR